MSFIIPDHIIIKNHTAFSLLFANRLLFAAYIVFLYWRLKNIKEIDRYAFLITLSEFLTVVFFLLSFFEYKPVNFLIQSFGLIVIISAFFLVPNYYKNILAVSIFTTVAFLITAVFVIEQLELMEAIAAAIYFLVIIMLNSISFLRANCYKRKQYANSQRLLLISTTDSLTKVFNRQKFNEELEREIKYAEENGSSLALILLDVDDFKEINDKFGHLQGDSVLIKLTEIITSNIKVTDLFARWGGEEFIILLPATNLALAAELAEKLRESINKSIAFPIEDFSCSFGVAALKPGETGGDFLQRVDDLLYLAKQKGKNQVMAIQN